MTPSEFREDVWCWWNKNDCATVRWKTMTIMLSRFHLMPERYGRTIRFAISISRVSMLTRDRNSRVRRIHMLKLTVQHYQQCCQLANGNKTCCSLLRFKNNNVARGSQGFVRQSSRNVALHVEQPSVLNKFFFRITIFCRVRVWEQKVCGWGLKIRQISSLFGPPCRLRMTSKNPSSNFSNDTQGPPRVKLSQTSVNQGRRIKRP